MRRIRNHRGDMGSSLAGSRVKRIILSMALICSHVIMAQSQVDDAGLAGASIGPPGSDLGLYLEISPQVVTFGDLVNIHLKSNQADFNEDQIITVSFEPGVDIWHVERDWGRSLEDDIHTVGKGWTAGLRAFDTGEPALPAVTVSLDVAGSGTLKLTLDEYQIPVNSVRQESDKHDELYGLRNPINPPVDRAGLWVALLVAFLLLSFGWLIYRRWSNRQAETSSGTPLEELPPPGLWALEELDRRSRFSLCRKGPPKAIYTHVSEVIRTYLGRRYAISAIDMTTLELLNALAVYTPGDDVMRWVREFLEVCDQVKFTKYEPPRDQWITIWNDARLIVKVTTPSAELTGESGTGSIPREKLEA